MNITITCHLGTITKGTIVVNLCIMRHVNTLHKEVSIANHSFAIGKGSTVYHHILSKDILVSNFQTGIIALMVEILRFGSKHSILIYLVTLAHACSIHDAHIGIDNAVVAYHHIPLDISKGIDSHIIPYLCFWVYVCFVTYITHNYLT